MTKRDRILAALWRAGNRGMTPDEIAAATGITILTVRPAISTMKKEGLVRGLRKFRKTEEGYPAEVMAYVPK